MVHASAETDFQIKHLKKSQLSELSSELRDDFISNLPDTVLCHILSFLPTKFAVGTSILSSKWKNLFPLIPNLNLEFDDSLILHHPNGGEEEPSTSKDADTADKSGEELKSSFTDFVGGVLKSLLQNNASICKFKLECQKKYTDDCIGSWLRVAVMLGVQSVCLKASIRDSCKLVASLNGCTSLLALHLDSIFSLKVSAVNFPNLKKLILDYVQFSDGESVELLFNGCPVLNTLKLQFCVLLVDDFAICMPSLTRLVICGSLIRSIFSTVVIDTPKLNHFSYVGLLTECYLLRNVDSIYALAVHILPINTLLEDHDEELEVSSYEYVKLAEALRDLSVPLPKFYNLKTLVLGAMGMTGWKTLACFLDNAPILEALFLFGGFNMYDGGFASFLSVLNYVPYCLASSMKKIEIGAFSGQEDEIMLLEYFLQNGKVLEKLVFNCDFDWRKNNAVFNRLLDAESGSETCKISGPEKGRMVSLYCLEKFYGVSTSRE
ncbi:OLC1v1025387C1 [Oldenlandia corymbosa var. corymbosa]|uniref:OLC1v1025387C1 n=1 Tax=Oldenlandia corymbosa var. corymbosa TaxID=529605 RepID=A0AAV1C6R6_OLDCO|nr:OLC1v1025387C1 [Oldenlandia corymbosa var. corymbosa]